MNQNNNQTQTSPSRSSWQLLVVTAALALGAAVSQPALAFGPGDHGRGGHGEHGGRGDLSPRYVQRMLDVVKATPEQRTQITQIAGAAQTDLAAQRDTGRKLHEQERAVFAQPNVDARAAEAVRQQRMAHQDQTSKRMLQLKLDISRVLSPEQRAALAQRMQKRGDMMQRHHQERNALDRPGA